LEEIFHRTPFYNRIFGYFSTILKKSKFLDVYRHAERSKEKEKKRSVKHKRKDPPLNNKNVQIKFVNNRKWQKKKHLSCICIKLIAIKIPNDILSAGNRRGTRPNLKVPLKSPKKL